MCKDIVKSPEFCGKLTFPVSLKQPGPRDGIIQCFINLTYHLFLCLSPALLVENGKFLLSAKRTRRTTYTEYVISMDADNISRSSNTYIGKLRSYVLVLTVEDQLSATLRYRASSSSLDSAKSSFYNAVAPVQLFNQGLEISTARVNALKEVRDGKLVSPQSEEFVFWPFIFCACNFILFLHDLCGALFAFCCNRCNILIFCGLLS